jgi:dihydrofolate reductase
MARPRISVFIAHSVDGYIATDDDSLDWLFASGAEGEDYGYDAFMADVDAVGMGRGTYRFLERMPEPHSYGRPVYVFTSHVDDTPMPGYSFWTRTPEQAVAEWEEAGHRRVYLDGGSLISQFLEAGLVDDLTLTLAPLLLGSGKRLFHRIPVSTPLRLVDVQAFPSGMVNHRYLRES